MTNSDPYTQQASVDDFSSAGPMPVDSAPPLGDEPSDAASAELEPSTPQPVSNDVLAERITDLITTIQAFSARADFYENQVRQLQQRVELLQADQVQQLLGPVFQRLAILLTQAADSAGRARSDQGRYEAEVELDYFHDLVVETLDLMNANSVEAASGVAFDRTMHVPNCATPKPTRRGMTQKGTEIPTVRNRRRPIMRGLLLVLGLFLLGAPAVSAAVPNPGWPGKCPLRLVIVVDLSTSMDPNLPQVKQSTRDLIDALRGAPNQVAVVAFGAAAAVAIPMGDVSDEDNRARMKDSVDTIALLPGDGGGTNWEFALTTAATLDPDVVVLLTDGQPTAHGDPYSQAGLADDANNVSAAVTVADEMRTEGVRVVGLGIGLTDEFTANLAEVSGPISGDDYYQTGSDADGLLSRLYDIASKACGLPVAALPQPEGANIPVAAIVAVVVGAMLLAILVGFLLSRRKSATVATTLKSVKLADPTIKRPAPPKVPNLSSRTTDPRATSDTSTDTQLNDRPRAPRARDISWLRDSDPPSQRGPNDP